MSNKIVRFFGDPDVKYYSTKSRSVTFSNAFFPAMWSALTDKYIRPTDYVLGPLYKNRNGFDHQVCITGSCLQGERPREAMVREMAQEVGLAPKSLTDPAYLELLTRKDMGKGKRASVFIAHMDDLDPLSEEEAGPGEDALDFRKGRDDRNRKVGCVVYGSFREMYNFLDDAIYRHHTDTDDIVGIVATPISVARDVYYSKLKRAGVDPESL